VQLHPSFSRLLFTVLEKDREILGGGNHLWRGETGYVSMCATQSPKVLIILFDQSFDHIIYAIVNYKSQCVCIFM
jgi:hypothetical protein